MNFRAMAFLLVLVLATTGCVASVLGPSGAPLTNEEVERLVEEYHRRPNGAGGSGCRWMHGPDPAARLDAGEHRAKCLRTAEDSMRMTAAGKPFLDSLQLARVIPDSLTIGAWYDASRPGRERFYLSAPHRTQCRIERTTPGELGRLKCWMVTV